jgi:hypothetical protein
VKGLLLLHPRCSLPSATAMPAQPPCWRITSGWALPRCAYCPMQLHPRNLICFKRLRAILGPTARWAGSFPCPRTPARFADERDRIPLDGGPLHQQGSGGGADVVYNHSAESDTFQTDPELARSGQPPGRRPRAG